MLKHLSLTFALLLVTTNSARAEICAQIYLAERLEADLVFPDPSNGTNDERTMHAPILNAQEMANVYVNDPPLVDAVADYVARFHQHQLSVASHTNPSHRASVRRMVSVSYDFCNNSAEQNSTSSQAADAPNGSLSARDAITWGIVNGRELLVLVPIAILAYVIFKRVQTRRKRSVRHICFVDVDVTSTAGTFSTKMVDISAIGAKIRLPRGTKLPAQVTLLFNGATHSANFIWHNRHFAGLQFRRPLRGRLVRALASAKQKRSVKDRRSTLSSGRS